MLHPRRDHGSDRSVIDSIRTTSTPLAVKSKVPSTRCQAAGKVRVEQGAEHHQLARRRAHPVGRNRRLRPAKAGGAQRTQAMAVEVWAGTACGSTPLRRLRPDQHDGPLYNRPEVRRTKRQGGSGWRNGKSPPLRRAATNLADIAYCVLYLASDDPATSTGQLLSPKVAWPCTIERQARPFAVRRPDLTVCPGQGLRSKIHAEPLPLISRWTTTWSSRQTAGRTVFLKSRRGRGRVRRAQMGEDHLRGGQSRQDRTPRAIPPTGYYGEAQANAPAGDSAVGVPRDEVTMRGVTYEEMRPGSYEVKAPLGT